MGSQRIDAIETEVCTEYSQFHLLDRGFKGGDEEDVAPLPSELISTGLAEVKFLSSASDHYPVVRLELWSGEPPDEGGAWEARQQLRFDVSVGRLRFFSIVS